MKMSEAASSLRIAHVVDYFMPTFGYQESLLPKWHVRHGHEVHVVTSDRYAPVPDYADSFGPILGPRRLGAGHEVNAGVHVHRLRGGPEWRSRIWLRGLRAQITEIAPDVIMAHSTTSPTGFMVARLGRQLGVPVVIDSHMVFSAMDVTPRGRIFYSILKRATARYMTPNVNQFLGVADECCRFLEVAQGIPAERITLLPLGLDSDLFHPDPDGAARVRRQLSIPDDAFVVMQTGKLTRDKSPDWLSFAAAGAMSTRPDLYLVFVGAGAPAYLDEVRQPLVQAGVDNRLRLAPMVPASELKAYFSAADLCVFPNAASLSSVEAAGCGAAVVMTDLPASRWRANENVGVCYPTGDLAELQSVIGKYADQPELARRLGATALRAVRSKYSYDRVSADLEELMSSLVRQHASVPPTRTATFQSQGSSPAVLIDASNLHSGGGVQVAASFLNELFHMGVDEAPGWRESAIVHVSTAVSCDLASDVLGHVLVRDSRPGAGFLWKWGAPRYDLAFSVFAPTYAGRRALVEVAGFADPTVASMPAPSSIAVLARVKRRVKRSRIRSLDHLIVESAALAADVSGLGVDLSRLTVVPNTCSSVFADDQQWEYPTWERAGSDLVLAYPARPYPHKNHQFLGQIARDMFERHGIRIAFAVTLTPDEVTALDADSQKSMIALGILTVCQVAGLYRQVDGVIFPSLMEVSSATPIEALAVGSPLFASRRSFIEEFVGDAAGYFDPLNAGSATDAIVKGLSDPALLERRAQRGLAQVAALPTARERAREYVRTIDRHLPQRVSEGAGDR